MDSSDYFLVDTFVVGPCSGNTTPVCLIDRFLSVADLQNLASTFGAAVSVFVSKSRSADKFQIRYFTVSDEIPACGHGTLAAAFCIFGFKPEVKKLVFETVEGRSLVASSQNKLTFVTYPRFAPESIDGQPAVLDALGIDSPQRKFYSPELKSLFIEVETVKEVESLKPDFARLLSNSDQFKEVVVMSASSSNDSDVVLRAFCPWVGIDEDPVTGSVHSVLGPYWQNRLGSGHQLRVFQASERGGKVLVLTDSDSVRIGGRCNLLVTGRLAVNDG